jgi:hypothetical protein
VFLHSFMIDLHEFHSLVDFGMCITLWLVQLVIYPCVLKNQIKSSSA